MLLALSMIACGTPEDTGAARLPLTSEVDSITGRYHLVLELDPDPATVGSQSGWIGLSENVEGAPVDGALVAGGNLTGTLTAPEEQGVDALSMTFTEDPLGTYGASWDWTIDGYWELRIVIGEVTEDDVATFGVLVEPAD